MHIQKPKQRLELMTDTHLGFIKNIINFSAVGSVQKLAVFIMAHTSLCPNKLELRVQGNFGLTAALENSYFQIDNFSFSHLKKQHES